jgi:hypothetical protein
MPLLFDAAFGLLGATPRITNKLLLDSFGGKEGHFRKQIRDPDTNQILEVLFLHLYAILKDDTLLTPELALTVFADGTVRGTHRMHGDLTNPYKYEFAPGETPDLERSVAFVVCPSPPTTPEEMFVKTLTGKTITIACDPATTTLWRFCQSVREKEGIPVDQMRLCFAGRMLTEDPRNFASTLVELGLQRYSTLHLILRLRGGMHHPTSGRSDYGSPNSDHTVGLTIYSSPTAQPKMFAVPVGTTLSDLKSFFALLRK